MKKLVAVAIFCALGMGAGYAHAQEFDAAIGFGTLTAPSASSATGDHFPQSMSGGLYPSFSADFMIRHRLGVGAEVAWRASRNDEFFQGAVYPYRPVLFDFNGIYAPRLNKFVTAELMGGIGAENIRYYQGYYSCGFTGCTDYQSSNHFMGHVGAGLRYYFWGHAFIRPEAHYYFIHNNVDFASGHAARFGVSLGYTFAPGF